MCMYNTGVQCCDGPFIPAETDRINDASHGCQEVHLQSKQCAFQHSCRQDNIDRLYVLSSIHHHGITIIIRAWDKYCDSFSIFKACFHRDTGSNSELGAILGPWWAYKCEAAKVVWLRLWLRVSHSQVASLLAFLPYCHWQRTLWSGWNGHRLTVDNNTSKMQELSGLEEVLVTWINQIGQ